MGGGGDGGAMGADGVYYSGAQWYQWNAANAQAAQAMGQMKSVDRTPQIKEGSGTVEEEGFQVDMDWSTPIATIQPGMFAKLAAAKIEDDAPMLTGTVPRAALNLRYGVM